MYTYGPGNPADFLGPAIACIIIFLIVFGITYLLRIALTRKPARIQGSSSGNAMEDIADFFRFIGLILKWLGKGLIFLIALFRREAPPTFSGTSKQEENLDEFEDDEDKPRKRRNIDEYHV